MIQQVNLYTHEFRPRKEHWHAGTAIGLVLAVVLVVAIAATFVRYQHASLDAQVAQMEARNARLEQVVVELAETVGARQPDPALEGALDRVSETLARRQLLLAKVEGLVSNNNTPFSPQMAALARQIPENVWLTGIRLEAPTTQVVIEGRAGTGALVPLYLQKLGKEPAFAGRTFGAFKLSRPEAGQWVDFRVATERGGGGN